MILLKNKDKKANIKIGNNIEIKDGNDFPFDLTLYGKSTQATRSGKNLFDSSQIVNVSDYIVANGTGIKIIKTTNGRISPLYNISLKANTEYTISCNLTSTTTYPTMYCQWITNDSSTLWVPNLPNGSKTFTPSKDIVGVIFYLKDTDTDGTYVELTNLQIEKGSTATDYEPYGVMPSPDYPSPIESVGRKNLFDYSKLNNDNTIQWTAYESLGTVFRALPIYVGKNKQVYFSSNVPELTSENAFYAINDINTGSSNVLNINNSRVVSSNNDGYVYLGVVTNRQYYEDVQNNVYWIMISTDNVEYLPYEHTEISATVTGKNLFDGIIEAGYINVNTGQNTGSINVRTKNYIPIQPNTQYTISSDTSHDTWACYYDNNFSFISNQQIKSNTSGTFTTPKNAYYIRWYDALSTGETPEWQLEQSPTASSYEEYKSNSLIIDLQGNELCSLPRGTKDELVVENGIAKIIKRVGKVVLDGSENWGKDDNVDNNVDYFYIKIIGIDNNNIDNVICDHFTKANASTQGFWATGVFVITINKTLTGITSSDTKGERITKFKTWLSTHNVEVLYELAEPKTVNLGTVEMPHTYEGVSNITNSADTEMIVKYYKKFEFDKILRSGYNIDEQEYEIAKKQMANGKRKKILSSYVDCIIKIDLGLLDNKTYQEYKEQLEDGEYEYWSYKYNQYKKANFILTKPSITTEYAYDDEIGIDDMEITLEKSSDVS